MDTEQRRVLKLWERVGTEEDKEGVPTPIRDCQLHPDLWARILDFAPGQT